MEIAYVITRADVIGGASVHLLDLAVGVQNSGHNVTLYAGGAGVFIEKAKAMGLECVVLKHMQREISPWRDLLGFFELRKIFKKTKPDLIHLHSSKAGILGRLAAKSLGVPAVFTAHGWAFTEGVSSKKRKFYLAIERFMAKFSDKIIAVSEYDRQLALRSKVGNNTLITTVHNGMPNIPELKRESTRNTVIKLVMVARFEVPKDHLLLINAVSQLKQSSWTLELIGDGALINQAIAYVKDLGLAERIIFSGNCDDVATRLEQADVFLLVSNWEGLPLSILEAMRAGLPVIASDVGGVPEAVLDGHTGYLVPRGNVDKLSMSIEKILDNEELRLAFGKAGRKRFDEEFIFDSMLNKTLDIYQQIINK